MKKRILGLVMIFAPFALIPEAVYYLDPQAFWTAVLPAYVLTVGMAAWIAVACWLVESYRSGRA